MISSFGLIVSISVILGAQCTKTSKKPHIVFILCDDLGWNDVSFHGSRQIPTPNIDTLAANSIVLNNYYTQPLCTPSRAALRSGKYPIRYGLQFAVLRSAQPAGLNLTLKLLPQHLKDLGYSTHLIGKWHLGFYVKEYTPLYRGFNSHLGYWVGAMDYYNHTFYESFPNTSLPYGWGRSLRRDMGYADELDGQYATELFTKEAEKIIKNHDTSKPMFLDFCHLAVHSANIFELFQAPQSYINRASYIQSMDRRVFAGMAMALDDSIGRVFSALEKKGMLDNTIFVVSTDNGGEAAGYRGGVGSNWPLRGNKATTWEGGTRGVSFIWSPLLKKKSPRISNELMHITDWLPTLFRAAGGNLAKLGDIDGQNMWNTMLHNKPSPRTEFLINIDPVDNVRSLRRGDYKLMIGSNTNGEYDQWYGPTGRDNGISETEYQNRLRRCDVTKVLKKRGCFKEVTPEWLSQLDVKCQPQNGTVCVPTVAPCLFNVIQDPCEQDNIADQNPQIVEEMRARLEQYNAEAVPLVNQSIDARADPRLYQDHWVNWIDLV